MTSSQPFISTPFSVSSTVSRLTIQSSNDRSNSKSNFFDIATTNDEFSIHGSQLNQRPSSYVENLVSSNHGRNVTDGIHPIDFASNTGSLMDDEVQPKTPIIMSVCWKSSQLGVAFYDAETCIINMCADIVETEDFTMLRKAITQIDPDIVLTFSRQDTKIYQALEDIKAEHSRINKSDLYKIEVLPTASFSSESAKHRIGSLLSRIRNQSDMLEIEELMTISAKLSFNNVTMISAIGGLITFLENKHGSNQLSESEAHIHVVDLQMFSLAGVMHIDKHTFSALQIFCFDDQSPPDKIEHNHKKLSLFTKISIEDWKLISSTIQAMIEIGKLSQHLPQSIPLFQEIVKICTTGTNQNLAKIISDTIDLQESKKQKRFIIRPGKDTQFDNDRRTYNRLPEILTKVASKELERLDNQVHECSVIYLPQLGFMLAIAKLSFMRSESDFLIDGLDFMFVSNDVAYYKSPLTKELDESLGDTQCRLLDKEIEIMLQLQEVVLQHKDDILSLLEKIAELDCLIALTILAKQNNFIRPKLTEANKIAIKKGRHPLQECCLDPGKFIPNDTYIEEQKDRINIITGPNASGKSVYLKQVGLIVYMAHIGSFVPAEEAEIGISDRIYTRIQTHETISVNLSAFAIELTEIATSLMGATEKSLILIDEFGKFTSPIDGLSLTIAIIEFWLEKRCPPKILISTHFTSIQKHNILPQSDLLKYQTMDTLIEKDNIAYLYQLLDGLSSRSLAYHVAAVAHIPTHVLSRGREIAEAIIQGDAITRSGSESTAERLKMYHTTEL
ncbi:MutS protein-like protein 5 [Trichoplax sp. H2]|nr:MutS protein-like protein 5 [Trichoplax sp. H2]|eukprot:RDD47879.1 MutS protein-like protein 5 [Trichoplax sp. H2]